MSPQSRFLLAIVLILTVITIGITGYSLIEQWSFSESLYMTIITLSTVGYGEVKPLTENGKIFTIFFVILSILTMGFTVTTLITYIFEGQILKSIKERRMKLFINKLKNHLIICGFGDVGREAAEELQRKKQTFVVIDKAIDPIDREAFPRMTFIEGDASEEGILEEAKIDKAKGLITCLPDDQTNVFTILTARELNPSLNIVSQASDSRNKTKLEKAGADRVISPKQIAGRRLASVSVQPSIVNFLDILSSGGDEAIRIEAFALARNCPIIGKTLRETNIGKCTGAFIIGIMDSEGRTRINPSSHAALSTIKLLEGDELISMGNEEQLQTLKEFMKRGE